MAVDFANFIILFVYNNCNHFTSCDLIFLEGGIPNSEVKMVCAGIFMFLMKA